MTESAESGGFQGGADFISFDKSPPPKPSPSLPPQIAPVASSSKIKQKNGKESKDGKGRGVKRGRDDETGPSNLKQERMAAERGCPWVPQVDWEACKDPAEMLNQEITAFYRHVSPTKVEYEVRLFVIELIIRAVHHTWPEATVTPFGSWQTQLYLPTGDIDLVVATKYLTESNKGRLLAELARAMRLAHITDTVAIISKARVPIIKFVTNEGKLNVDISLNQTNGISAGRIINQYLDVLPGARALVLVVKAFLSQRSMNEVYTGGIGSYAVICLVISFLQIHPKLRLSEMDPEENLGTLLVEFFELYGRNFNYDDVGISIRRGGFYYSKRSRGWTRPGQAYLLSIEDPQDRDNDISGGSFGIRQVRATLAGAYDLLQAKLFERAEQISSRQMGRKTASWQPEDMSLLTAIMGITKETMKHRAGLKKLHEEGRLQRMLAIPPKTTDVHPFLTHYAQTSSTTSTRRPSDMPQPSEPSGSAKRRRGDDALGAIMVHDDEVDELDSDSESDADGEGNDQETDMQMDSDSPADLEQSGRVRVDRFPNGKGGVERAERNGYASVSEDGEVIEHYNAKRNDQISEGDEEGGARSDLEEGEVDTRYDIPKTSKRRLTKADLKLGEKRGSDSDTDSDGSSIIALDKPPQKPQRSGSKPLVTAKDRQAYWKAKAQPTVYVVSDDDP